MINPLPARYGRLADLGSAVGVIDDMVPPVSGVFLNIDASRLDDLRPEIRQLEAQGICFKTTDRPVRRPDELLLTCCSPTHTQHATELVRASRSVLVAVPDLDGMLTAQFIAAGAAAVWNRLADPRHLPTLIRRLSRRAHQGPPLNLEELQLLAKLATNSTIREIAEELFISERSFYRRLKSLYAKLGVCGRADAVNYARASALYQHSC